MSSAEVLPAKFIMPASSSTFDVTTCHDEDPDSSLRHMNSFLHDIEQTAEDPHGMSIGPGTLKGPRRYLQHGTPRELFWEYIAFCQIRNQVAASYTKFKRVFKAVKKTHLACRRKHEHNECDVCNRFKRLYKTASAAERKKMSARYVAHLLHQWLDRQVYWSMRTMSQQWWASMRLGNRLVWKVS